MNDSAGVSQAIAEAVTALIGLSLVRTSLAGNMRVFHFGATPKGATEVEENIALHIQCPWRMEHDGVVITGSGDYYLRRLEDGEIAVWSPELGGIHIQNEVFNHVFRYDPVTKAHVNTTMDLLVERFEHDATGDLRIYLSGGYRIVVFPSSSVDEHWRLFRVRSPEPHFVVEGTSYHVAH